MSSRPSRWRMRCSDVIPTRRSRRSAPSADSRRGAFQPADTTLLAFGGSQGARRVNDAVYGAARDLLDAGVQVLHLTGPRWEVRMPSQRPQGPTYLVLPYCERMDLAYAVADLALCRAGMTTCA